MSTDIVIGTRNRADLLKETIEHIIERTRSPYHLHIIDDASTKKNALYVRSLHRQGIVASVLRRQKQAGISANLRALLSITQSDPIVFTDDDVLCPDVEPDWLARELEAMAQRPRLGILSLYTPEASSMHSIERGPEVILYRNVGGVFAMIRRAVLEKIVVPTMPKKGSHKSMRYLCIRAIKAGFEVGCLAETYCQHIGAVSIRSGRDYSARLKAMSPINNKTLEPPDVYKS